MRIVAALGGNALLQRRDRPDAVLQRHHVHDAVAALRPLAEEHELLVTHGNGPQVGVLALESDGTLRGVEAVVDKDATASLLARELDADLLLVLTDVPAVSVDWGTPAARAIRSAVPAELRARSFPAGSMGPKVAAVCDFVEQTGRPAAIGALADVSAIVAGEAGTTVRAAAVGGGLRAAVSGRGGPLSRRAGGRLGVGPGGAPSSRARRAGAPEVGARAVAWAPTSGGLGVRGR
ncbi:MAG TPA: hypothetical protein VFN60_05200 [Acidimicrobiales bacterium]|nr:hypothetical protein [Acidimicrobiales bacterium]